MAEIIGNYYFQMLLELLTFVVFLSWLLGRSVE